MKLNLATYKDKYCKKGFFRHIICHKKYLSDDFMRVLKTPDDFCNKNILKEDETFTTTVAKIIINKKSFVIKRYNIKSFSHGLKRSVRQSRASRNFYFAHLLKDLGIKTPSPIAIIEKRFGPFRRQAYYISEYIDGPDAFAAFTSEQAHLKLSKERAKRILNLLCQLKQYGLYHGDLKASNFLFQESTPYIIDLDAMRQYKLSKKTEKYFAKDYQRFMQNWDDKAVLQLFSGKEDE